MIYRVYRASSYKEAVLKAKMDLGSDVYIIARKEVREGGFLGMFGKMVTEITVAKNDENGKKAVQRDSRERDAQTTDGVKVEKKADSGGTEAVPDGVTRKDSLDGSSVMTELMEIKRQLRRVLEWRDEDHVPESGALEELVEQLRCNDFSSDYLKRLREHFETELRLKDVQDPAVLREKLKEYVLGDIQIAGPIEGGTTSPQVVVLVGPTGVGKTTTIAKLAASFGVLQKKKVELFTIDSYRIAAIEQLGKYAELMQLPFTVINSREEFKNAVVNSKSEIIFVDTVGRSQKNNLGLAELRDILDGVKTKMDVHLVLSATTKYRDAIDVVTRFNQLMYTKIILTKLDETNTIGPLLSVLSNGKKLSYFTTGQSVPDDIEIARKEKLFELVCFDTVGVESGV
jgi:flagellar biosynthesis protein FlhF